MSTGSSLQDSVGGPMLPISEINTFGDDLALDRAKHVPQQERLASAKAPTETKARFFPLPPELRVMIYIPLIKVGDLNILRVSKLISQEAIPLLSKHAVFRFNVGPGYRPLVNLDLTDGITLLGHSTLIAPDYIQHVKFQIDMVNFTGRDIDLRFINYFGGNKIARKSCIITISLNKSAEVPYRLENDKTYRAIATLTGFKVLVLNLECESDAEAVAAIRGKYSLTRVLVERKRAGQRMLRCYGNISAFLQTTLGLASLPGNMYRRSLVFWPSQYGIGACSLAAAKASGGEM